MACVGMKGKPCYKKRIYRSGLADDEFQMAETIRRVLQETVDKQSRFSSMRLPKQVEKYTHWEDGICLLAANIGRLLKEQDYYAKDDPRAFNYEKFMRAARCRD
tara:strand:+ start:234 stop:545 length:312 start_codon:yes stop_codon:yes gene_type:complete